MNHVLQKSLAHAVSKEAEAGTGPEIDLGETMYGTDAQGLAHGPGIESDTTEIRTLVRDLLNGSELSPGHAHAHDPETEKRNVGEGLTHVRRATAARMTIGSDEGKKRADARRARKEGKNARRRRGIKRYSSVIVYDIPYLISDN